MTQIKTSDELIALFFKDEKEIVTKPGLNSIFYLLKREIKHCFGINPETGLSNGVYAKWPGTMAIMAGIDLLAKYYSGSLDLDNSKEKFKTFLKLFWNLNDIEQEIIYQLRNSLLHSFALYSIDKKGKEYKFTLIESTDKMIVNSNENNYVIDIDKLCEAFFTGANNYKDRVIEEDILKTNLIFVFCKIGAIKID